MRAGGRYKDGKPVDGLTKDHKLGNKARSLGQENEGTRVVEKTAAVPKNNSAKKQEG